MTKKVNYTCVSGCECVRIPFVKKKWKKKWRNVSEKMKWEEVKIRWKVNSSISREMNDFRFFLFGFFLLSPPIQSLSHTFSLSLSLFATFHLGFLLHSEKKMFSIEQFFHSIHTTPQRYYIWRSQLDWWSKLGLNAGHTQMSNVRDWQFCELRTSATTTLNTKLNCQRRHFRFENFLWIFHDLSIFFLLFIKISLLQVSSGSLRSAQTPPNRSCQSASCFKNALHTHEFNQINC